MPSQHTGDTIGPTPSPILPIEAAIFDMEGTLLDTEAVHRAAFLQAAATLGLAISDAAYRSLVGISTRERGAVLRRRYGVGFPWEALRGAY